MENKKTSIIKILSFLGFPLLFAGIILVTIFNFRQIFDFFNDSGSVKEFIASKGVFGPLIFIGLQILQVVVFIIPGEVTQIAGGYLFGTLLGTVFSVVGIVAGSAINFYLGRLLGIPFVRALFKKEQIDKVESLITSSKSRTITTLAIFGIFLIPAFPKDIITYIAGLTPIRFSLFLIVSGLGRLPGILVSGIIGDAASNKDWLLVGIVSAVGVLLFVLGFVFRDKIMKYMQAKFDQHDGEEKKGDGTASGDTDKK
jgi:uncharacterized membrane protein YdjX (TVP38/TMEM64 family)